MFLEVRSGTTAAAHAASEATSEAASASEASASEAATTKDFLVKSLFHLLGHDSFGHRSSLVSPLVARSACRGRSHLWL